jgi:hypothetical protein
MENYLSEDIIKNVVDICHGSGLDTTPVIVERKKSWLLQWEYHLMNNAGYYDGWWGFTVLFPKDDPMEFKLRGRRGNPRRASAWGVDEYVGEQVCRALEEALKESGVSFEMESDKVFPGDPGYKPDLLFAREHGYHFGRSHYEYKKEEQCSQETATALS